MQDSLKLSYDDVLLTPQYSEVGSRSDVDISTTFGTVKLDIPIISSNMDTITNVKMAKKMGELGGLGLIHRYMSEEEQLRIIESWPYEGPILGLSLGTLSNDKKRIDTTINYINMYSGVDEKNVVLCIDIAHGDSKHMLETIEYVRAKGWEGTLMAGATCTPEGTSRLLNAGADIVRVGVGNGSACSTRIKTGCGYPQFSAVLECAEIGPIIADGGIRTPGDAAKALAAGAKAVMIGGMLAGTDCVPGWDIAMKSYFTNIPHSEYTDISRHPNDMPSISYRGMASKAARAAFGQKPVNAEGISCTVKAKPEGSTEMVIQDLGEGIRSAMSYSNSNSLEEFKERAIFQRVTSNVVNENIPHFLNRKDAS